MITDDDLLLPVRQSLSGLHMQTPVETILRTGRTRQRRRRLVRSTAVAAAGIAAAVVGTSITWTQPAPRASVGPTPASTTTPAAVLPAAFTVSTSSEGINLSMYKGRQLDPAALRQALARAGIPALVTVGEFCRTPRQPGGQLPAPKDPGDGSLDLTIDPASIPPGAELSIGYFPNYVRFLLIEKNVPLSCSTGQLQPAYHQSIRSGIKKRTGLVGS